MGPWVAVSTREVDQDAAVKSFRAGAFQNKNRWLALNRPAHEDELAIINEEALADLFSGLDYRVIRDSVDNRSALAAEIWRAFLVAMALALIIEAALCLPPKREPEPVSPI